MSKKVVTYKPRERNKRKDEREMPSVRPNMESGVWQGTRKDDVVAIACSDIHLSHTPPIFRSKEPDWYATQKGYLEQLSKIKHEYQVPILCAGDIFDKWNPPVELVNFAIEHLPQMYAIPGQHDLPFHSYKDIERSGYWNLVLAGVIYHSIVPGIPVSIGELEVYGFPWGFEITPPKKINSLVQYICMAHSYIWTRKTGYPTAPVDKKFGSYKEKLEGFDVAIFGDNHKGFLKKMDACNVLNCGGFMIRKSDEVDYKPIVGLIKSTGEITRVELDISKDVYLSQEDMNKTSNNFDFVSKLMEMGDSAINFSEAINRELTNPDITDEVKNIILRCMR